MKLGGTYLLARMEPARLVDGVASRAAGCITMLAPG